MSLARFRTPVLAVLGLCLIVAMALTLPGCGRRQPLELNIRPSGQTIEVGQTVTFILWNDSTDTEEDAKRWDWYVSPEGAECDSGEFTATEPGYYTVSVLRDEWDTSDQPLKVNVAHITVVAKAPSEVLYDNHNDQGVSNGGTPASFEILDQVLLTSVETYHWNDAAGVGETGEISLQAEDGTVYGPWKTDGREGQGGAPNAYWTAVADIELPPGNYIVIDSDPGTWSQNAGTGGEGMVRISVEAESATD